MFYVYKHIIIFINEKLRICVKLLFETNVSIYGRNQEMLIEFLMKYMCLKQMNIINFEIPLSPNCE